MHLFKNIKYCLTYKISKLELMPILCTAFVFITEVALLISLLNSKAVQKILLLLLIFRKKNPIFKLKK